MTPEIPPPPRMPSVPSMSVRGPGWTITVPGALLVALLTTVGTTAAAYLTRDPPLDRRAIDKISARLDAIEQSQRAILDRVEHDARDASNRDAIQNIQIEALKNR